MKVAFKVINILLLVFTVIPAAIGAVSGLILSTSELGGLAFFGTILALIPAAVTIYMAIKGLQCDYGTASKIAFFILFIDVILLFISSSKASCIFQIILLGIYIYMAKSLQKIW